MIKAVKFVSVPVSDQDRALAFYTEKLGMRVITDSPFDGSQRWIELGIPRAETRLVLFATPGQEKMRGGFMNISFMADDVAETARVLAERGVEFVKGPEKADWGTFAIFKDPDGNQLEFICMLPDAPQSELGVLSWSDWRNRKLEQAAS